MNRTATPALSPAPPTATTVDAVVLAAMDSEIAPYEQRATEITSPRQMGAARTALATIGGRPVLLVRTGVGMVNAAVATALAVHAVRTPVVVSSGSAGGLGVGVRVGDVVVGSDYAYNAADATAFGYAMGQVPGMPATFPGSPALIERVQQLRPGVLVGQMVSSDSFVDARSVDRVRAQFPHALTTDMESAAIAHTCHLFGLPFISVRGVSDLCGPRAEQDFSIAVDDVAALAADLALELTGI